MSSGVHVQESYRVWSRNIDPRSKEMYVFAPLEKCPMSVPVDCVFVEVPLCCSVLSGKFPPSCLCPKP